jgi:uncharacterized protein YjeT (DUF2065 family)
MGATPAREWKALASALGMIFGAILLVFGLGAWALGYSGGIDLGALGIAFLAIGLIIRYLPIKRPT